MNLSNLTPAKGSTHKEKRVGRGQGSGFGGTSTRGHKGAQSRSGYSRKSGFEGGQMPLQRRVPKRGFKNINRVDYTAMNLDRILEIAEKLATDNITIAALREHNIISKTELIKVLASGELTKAVTIEAHAASETAKAAFEKAGGNITLV